MITKPQITAPAMVKPPVKIPTTTKTTNGTTRATVAINRPTGPNVVPVLRQRVLTMVGASVGAPRDAVMTDVVSATAPVAGEVVAWRSTPGVEVGRGDAERPVSA